MAPVTHHHLAVKTTKDDKEFEMKAVQVGHLEQDIPNLKEFLGCLISEKEATLRDLEVADKKKRDLEKKIIRCKAKNAKIKSGHEEEGLYDDLSIDEYNQLLERVEQGKRRLAIEEEEHKRLMKELFEARKLREANLLPQIHIPLVSCLY